MKKILILFLFIISFEAYAQDLLTVKGGGNVFNSRGVKMDPDQVRELLVNNQEALNLYNAGRSKKTVGNILLYGGTIGVAYFVYDYYTIKSDFTYNTNHQTATFNLVKADRLPAIIGGVMILAAIPIKIGFKNKIKSAIEMVNSDFKNQKVSTIESSSIIINQNGVGIALNF